MSSTKHKESREAQYRDALMASILPSIGGSLPGIADVDLTSFWKEFSVAAPIHLRLGLRTASFTLGVLPRISGYGRALPDLDAPERERFIVQASSMPGISFLVEVAKVVAGLAYFTDPSVQVTARAMGLSPADSNEDKS